MLTGISIFGIDVMTIIEFICLLGFISFIVLAIGQFSKIILNIGKVVLFISLAIAALLIVYLCSSIIGAVLANIFNTTSTAEFTLFLTLVFGALTLFGMMKTVKDF